MEGLGRETPLLMLLREGDRILAEAQASVRSSEKLLEIAQKTGQRLVDVLELMRQQAAAMGRLLHWIWESNSGRMARLDSLLSQDQAFMEIDNICRQLASVKVQMSSLYAHAWHYHLRYGIVRDVCRSTASLWLGRRDILSLTL
jgi:hypothetical protein